MTKIKPNDVYELTYEILHDRLKVDRSVIEFAAYNKFGKAVSELDDTKRDQLFADLEWGVTAFARSLSRQLAQAKDRVQPLVNILKSVDGF